MRILHIIRDIDEARSLEVAREQQRRGHEVSLLLIHDAVLSDIDFEQVVAARDDVLARGGEVRYALVDYEDMVRTIFEHDRVVSW
jgi:sulfur transfer complex TusBCD TusB component (DsrH family)